MTPFYMIHVEGLAVEPTYKHTTLEEAMAEAERLICTTGKRVYVLLAISVGEQPMPPIEWTPLNHPRGDMEAEHDATAF